MTSSRKTSIQPTKPTPATPTTLQDIERLILRITNGRVEVADTSVEGGVAWRPATDDEREAFGERIWEGI